jgi:ribosomal protein L37E
MQKADSKNNGRVMGRQKNIRIRIAECGVRSENSSKEICSRSGLAHYAKASRAKRALRHKV